MQNTQTPPAPKPPVNDPPNGFEQHRKPKARTNWKFFVVGAVVVTAALVLVVTAMQGSSVYYYTVAEFSEKQANLVTADSMRVSGKVLPGSIKKDEISRSISFTAIDRENSSKTLTVAYAGIIPDTFKDEAEVVVTGSYAQGVFQAKEMLAKCPSKYSSEK